MQSSRLVSKSIYNLRYSVSTDCLKVELKGYVCLEVFLTSCANFVFSEDHGQPGPIKGKRKCAIYVQLEATKSNTTT